MRKFQRALLAATRHPVWSAQRNELLRRCSRWGQPAAFVDAYHQLIIDGTGLAPRVYSAALRFVFNGFFCDTRVDTAVQKKLKPSLCPICRGRPLPRPLPFLGPRASGAAGAGGFRPLRLVDSLVLTRARSLADALEPVPNGNPDAASGCTPEDRLEHLVTCPWILYPLLMHGLAPRDTVSLHDSWRNGSLGSPSILRGEATRAVRQARARRGLAVVYSLYELHNCARHDGPLALEEVAETLASGFSDGLGLPGRMKRRFRQHRANGQG